MRILFLTPYPHGEAPSQRFRFEQYLHDLHSKKWQWDEQSFFTHRGWQRLYHGGVVTRMAYTLWGFLRRFTILGKLHRYHLVFIHREATPLGPPWVEWLIAKVWRKKIIYDFDDAIWLEDPDEKGTLLAKLKWKKKVAVICRWSWKVSAGNQYLIDFAIKSGAKNVVLNPTTVDMQTAHVGVKNQKQQPLTIGWTGTHSTVQYLKPLVPTLQKLAGLYSFRFLVISNEPPDLDFPNLEFRKWNKATEVEDLKEMHIGVMPLTDDAWSKGKCGFKAIQYLSLGIPPVISPVGVNKEIVLEGQSGFLASTPKSWEQHLATLLESEELRIQFGTIGQMHIRQHYSTESNHATFLSLFE